MCCNTGQNRFVADISEVTDIVILQKVGRLQFDRGCARHDVF